MIPSWLYINSKDNYDALYVILEVSQCKEFCPRSYSQRLMEPGPEPDLLIPKSCLVILCSIASLVKGNMLAVKVLKQREGSGRHPRIRESQCGPEHRELGSCDSVQGQSMTEGEQTRERVTQYR